jgi:hypothetical protein
MSRRDELVARKGEVQARIRSLQPKVEAARARVSRAAGLSRAYHASRLVSLESQLADLEAEEMRLRLEIDRAPR